MYDPPDNKPGDQKTPPDNFKPNEKPDENNPPNNTTGDQILFIDNFIPSEKSDVNNLPNDTPDDQNSPSGDRNYVDNT